MLEFLFPFQNPLGYFLITVNARLHKCPSTHSPVRNINFCFSQTTRHVIADLFREPRLAIVIKLATMSLKNYPKQYTLSLFLVGSETETSIPWRMARTKGAHPGWKVIASQRSWEEDANTPSYLSRTGRSRLLLSLFVTVDDFDSGVVSSSDANFHPRLLYLRVNAVGRKTRYRRFNIAIPSTRSDPFPAWLFSWSRHTKGITPRRLWSYCKLRLRASSHTQNRTTWVPLIWR